MSRERLTIEGEFIDKSVDKRIIIVYDDYTEYKLVAKHHKNLKLLLDIRASLLADNGKNRNYCWT